jgi:hypothetical protein
MVAVLPQKDGKMKNPVIVREALCLKNAAKNAF